MRRVHVSPLTAVLLFAAVTSLTAQPAPPRVTVTGTVFDSLARAPLAGAEVQLVADGGNGTASAFVVSTDADGRYRVDSVPEGRYQAGFFHPRVDSLGIGIAPVVVALRGPAATIAFGMPSARSVQRQLCDASEISDSTALLVGFVRDAATGAPRRGASVRLRWSELTLDRAGVRTSQPEIVVQTRGDGWYGVCGVPTSVAGDVGLVAVSGGDTSGVVPLRDIAAGVARRDLYVGAATPTSPTSLAASTRVRGVVRNAKGNPIAEARVRLLGGSGVATTDAAGTFTLVGEPAGTRLLDVRALGYLPTQLSVDVLADARSGDVAVTMTGVKTYLDTVRIAARSTYDADVTGFDSRRRSTPNGYFLDRNAIAQRNAVLTTDLLLGVAGMRVTYAAGGQPQFQMRTPDGGICSPPVFIDGLPLLSTARDSETMPTGATNDIDLFTTPPRLHGVEVYRDPASVPARFHMGPTGCGVIAMWTRPRDPAPQRDADRR